MDSSIAGLDDRGVRQSEKRASVGVPSGVGDWSSKSNAGRVGLCGRGDMSMLSIKCDWTGEETTGGVVSVV